MVRHFNVVATSSHPCVTKRVVTGVTHELSSRLALVVGADIHVHNIIQNPLEETVTLPSNTLAQLASFLIEELLVELKFFIKDCLIIFTDDISEGLAGSIMPFELQVHLVLVQLRDACLNQVLNNLLLLEQVYQVLLISIVAIFLSDCLSTFFTARTIRYIDLMINTSLRFHLNIGRLGHNLMNDISFIFLSSLHFLFLNLTCLDTRCLV